MARIIVLPSYAPFTPAALSGLGLWFDAAEITGLSNGQQIPQWNDRGPHGYHLLSSGSGSPQYYTNRLNGLPAVRDVGSGSLIRTQFTEPDFLGPNPPGLANITGANQCTMYTVGYAVSGVNSLFFRLTDQVLSGIEAHIFWGIGDVAWDHGTGSGSSTFMNPAPSIPPFTLNAWHNMEWYRNGTGAGTGEIYDNGSLLGTGAMNQNYTSTNSFRISFESSTNVEVGEIVVFNRALNPTERVQMRNYLTNKWGI